jgi:hypothetical protein
MGFEPREVSSTKFDAIALRNKDNMTDGIAVGPGLFPAADRDLLCIAPVHVD